MLFVARALIIGLGSRVVANGTARIVHGNARPVRCRNSGLVRVAFAVYAETRRRERGTEASARRARGERESESENERCLFVETDRHGSLVVNYYGNWRCKTRDRARHGAVPMDQALSRGRANRVVKRFRRCSVVRDDSRREGTRHRAAAAKSVVKLGFVGRAEQRETRRSNRIGSSTARWKVTGTATLDSRKRDCVTRSRRVRVNPRRVRRPLLPLGHRHRVPTK